jgi:hypothetical protein
MFGGPEHKALRTTHLDDPILLAYMDGELSAAEKEGAKSHLESCWRCRRRLGVLEERIGVFVDSQPAEREQIQIDHAQRVRQFRERLSRHAEELEAQRTFADTVRDRWHGFAGFLNLRRGAVIASVVAAGILLVLFTDTVDTRVSADTVLSRAQGHESTVRPHPGQVRRISVRVERIDRGVSSPTPLGNVTLLEDGDTQQTAMAVEPVTGKEGEFVVTGSGSLAGPATAVIVDGLPPELNRAMQTQHWLPAVSVEAFRNLMAGLGAGAAKIEKDSAYFTVIFPFAIGRASGLSEARLRVDQKTYAAMGLSLFLGSANAATEYRFMPVLATTEARGTEFARLFSTHSSPVSVHPIAQRVSGKVVPLSYAATRATDAEVRLTSALHKADACMGEEIHVFPMSDGSLFVQGLVDKPERRDAVIQALRAVEPSLKAQIFLPRELKNGSQLFDLPYKAPDLPSAQQTGTATLADLSSERIPLYQQLYRHFSRPGASEDDTNQQINAFSNEAVTIARESFLHAWALKKLDLQFSAERAAELSPAAVRELEQMRQDHRRWIAALSRRQAEMLSVIVKASPKEVEAADTRVTDTDSLVRLTREQNELVRSLFTVSSDQAEPDATLARLVSLLRRMGS